MAGLIDVQSFKSICNFMTYGTKDVLSSGELLSGVMT